MEKKNHYCGCIHTTFFKTGSPGFVVSSFLKSSNQFLVSHWMLNRNFLHSCVYSSFANSKKQ